jgi:hypothetical protein
MNTERFEFRIDIEDFENRQEVLNSIDNILKLIYNKKIMKKIDRKLGNTDFKFQKNNLTLIISRINDTELPF